MKNEKWFALKIDEIEKKLKTNAASGLSLKAARSRGEKKSGDLFFIPKRSPWRLLGDLVLDFALILLMLGALFSLFFGKEEMIRGVTVSVIMIGNIAVCAIMHYRSQRMMESISSFYYPMAKVIRSGRLFHMDFRSVVVGDVIIIEKGDIICCDARLVNSDKLRVNMRVNKKNFISLEKFSDGHVMPNETRAREMVNMVHAGSIVESGSARAIVTAVGRYTYLGALTGGIPISVSNKMPVLLEKMRKQFSRVNFISLLAIIPFCVISFIMEKLITGNTSVLSVTFLAALALAATTMSQLICTVLKLFYTAKIRNLFLGKDAAVLRSVDTFDKLAEADYVFMMDGCAVTDGLLHFDTVLSAEGELRNFSSYNKTYKTIAEYAHLYCSTATASLTTGVSAGGDYFDGIREFVKKTKIDTEALKFRCSILSYAPGNMRDIPERIYFRDGDRRMYLNISCSSDILRSCKYSMYGGEYRPMSLDGIKALEKTFRDYTVQGKRPILIALASEKRVDEDLCFLGMLILKEGIDRNASESIKNIERLGCKVISFVDCKGFYPSLPSIAIGGRGASREDFIRNRLAITYNFGSINTYSDLFVDDVKALISYAHSKNQKVVVMGFSEAAVELSEIADGFITCTDINPKISGYFKEEIKSSELAGEQGSSSCVQTVKDNADCLIPRPKRGKGGLSSLLSLFKSVRSVQCNISDSIRYMISTNIITAIMVALPLIFGNAVLDARHVMLSAFVLNMFAFLSFMKRSNVYTLGRNKNYCDTAGIKDYFSGDPEMLISSIAAAVGAVIMPKLLEIIIGDYNYPTEVLFTELLLLHVVVFTMMYYCGDYTRLRFAYKNKLFVALVVFVIFLWVLCVFWQEFGVLFGVDGWMTLPYFLIAFVPSVIYVVIFTILRQRRTIKF